MSLYKSLGFVFVGIATLGIFLPLLPTTPFLLVAAACFAKSSDKWHQWLISNRVFGPIITRWHEKKCVTRATKVVALSSIIIFGGYAVGFALTGLGPKALGVLVVVASLYFVLRIKVCKNGAL